jgi:hypothetical protein
MPNRHVLVADTGLPIAIIEEVHDMLTLALDASERRDGYSQAERETRSYVRTALRRTEKLMGERK